MATSVNARELSMMAKNSLRNGENELYSRKRSGKVEFMVSVSVLFIYSFSCGQIFYKRFYTSPN